MKTAREMAHTLRMEPNVTPGHLAQAAAIIETLIDVVEAMGGDIKYQVLRGPIGTEWVDTTREVYDREIGGYRRIVYVRA